MRVLVIGSGGREHALAWRLSLSPTVERVWVAPGNPGTAREAKVENVALSDLGALADFAAAREVTLTVVGPEAPLAQGLVNVFRERGLTVFGPTREAARLESSKDFAKSFMKRHGIPTADYQTFTRPEPAHEYIDHHGAPLVVKADGLAAGKGVVVAETAAAAHAAVDDMLAGQRFGAAGSRVVIEDFLRGEEASFIVVSDGREVLPLASSQDHKRLLSGDRGPNTGGMGAYSPAPVVTPEVHQIAMERVIRPTIAGMAADGHPFVGFLYAGLMIERRGDRPEVRVLEFNCRMGDPETQPIMARVRGDLAGLLLAAAQGQLAGRTLSWDERPALGVVLAAEGYPEHPRRGQVIANPPPDGPDHHLFHAGTARDASGRLVTAGGRVCCAVGLGADLRQARETAYRLADQVRFEGKVWRDDIGARALDR